MGPIFIIGINTFKYTRRKYRKKYFSRQLKLIRPCFLTHILASRHNILNDMFPQVSINLMRPISNRHSKLKIEDGFKNEIFLTLLPILLCIPTF
ncbi:hypothetical protein BpHYR1_001709 [Brachionus plicatilis]|uniref:Uncharacterized protein n=1 Tax=Brachionus plicatilis TaxID=10195 RepID=A0A3M7SZQ7_BRAPC|nr:hypothetical protein BpHYR1_001709 [Brachionus plicatilis]